MHENHQFDVITLARDGQHHRINCAVQGGADVNAKNAFDETALMCACFFGHHNCVKILLSLGANVNVKDYKGVTPLMWASLKGYAGSVKMILKKGGNVNDKDINGVTALMRACRHGYVECVKVLLENGANVNEKKDENVTPLMIAVFNKQSECAKILLENGANVNDKDIFGFTALMFAAIKGDLVCVKLLLDHAANVNERNVYGETALMRAYFNGHIECANVLLQYGSNVEDVIESKHPNTPTLPQEVEENEIKPHRGCNKCQCDACREEKRQHENIINKQSEEISSLKRKISRIESESTSAWTSIPPDMYHIDYFPPEKRRLFDQISDNKDRLVHSLQPRPVIEHLWSKGILTEEQYQEVKSSRYPTDISKSKYLLGLLKFGPEYLEALRESLTKTNQKHLLACLTLGSD